MNKLIIITAPSGAGKTTIVKHLLGHFPQLAFSVSATTRARRDYELDGRDYYFITPEEFRERIANDEFAEWQEVYTNQFYGTLKKELERLWSQGHDIVFDIDVKGALNLKQAYPDRSLAIFIQPPSHEILVERLKRRRTESEESLKKRIAKVDEELSYANKFDLAIVNDVLDNALETAENAVSNFIKG